MAYGLLRRLPAFLLLMGVFFIYSPAAAEDKLSIYTVNYPLQYMAQRIAGDSAEVVFPAPRDLDPAFWRPSIQAVQAYQKADLILLNGAGYAKWVPRVSLPRFRLVNTTANHKERYIMIKGAMTHSHGPGGKHAHEGLAFTTWLDFELAARQAEAIAQALVRKRPGEKTRYEAALEELRKELAALDAELAGLSARKPGLPLIASHPVYQYLQKKYALNLKSLHWEPDREPGPKQWAELKAMLKDHPAAWMIWEGSPLPKVVKELEDLGVTSLLFDPCAQPPDEGDFLSVMRANIKELKKAYR